MGIEYMILTIVIGAPVVLGAVVLLGLMPRRGLRNMRKPLMGVFYAHRGLFDNGSEAPENSLAAFRKAVEAGYGMELDVQLSKDEQLVVFHDWTLQRMCGVEGKVRDYTLEELRQFRLMHSDEKIPTLEEFLKLVDGKAPFILEYKMEETNPLVCQLGDQLLRSYEGPYCIESFHPMALWWYRKNRPDILRGQLCEEFFRKEAYKGRLRPWLMSFMPFNLFTKPDFVAYNHHHAGNPARCLCKWLGGLAVAYTIKSEAEYEKARNQFDLFIFDSCFLK